MSWDIFFQDLPDGITSIAEIPEDFMPVKTFGLRADVFTKIADVLPGFKLINEEFGEFECDDGSIDIDFSGDDTNKSFSLSVRGNANMVAWVKRLVDAFGGRAIVVGSESGLFDAERSLQSFEEWKEYRDHVVGDSK